jgi:TatA/E family protein of Tat protein translocase
MFGPLGFPELVFILVLALLIFGPKRLPEVGRTIGKGVAQFRRATTDLKRTIETEIALEEEAPGRAARPAALPPPRPVPAPPPADGFTIPGEDATPAPAAPGADRAADPDSHPDADSRGGRA